MSSSLETEKVVVVEQQPAAVAGSESYSCMAADVGLRVSLLAASILAVVLLVTSKQTEMIPVPTLGITVPRSAKFDQSPALIYFLVALSIAGLYSIITTITSISAMGKPRVSPKYLCILALHDLLILGIVASATGTAGGTAYIGLKGNSHVMWGKICGVYDKFCRFTGSAIAISLFASVVLVLLVSLNVYSLYRRTPAC